MSTVIYLDFDLCASPFSFDAEADATEDGAIKRTIDKTYDHKDDPIGQADDYHKVRDYFQTKLMPFLEAYWSRITILTANSARNVIAILLHFCPEVESFIMGLKVVSTFDDKGEQAGISPNLFGAVVKKKKNDAKPVNKQKPMEQIAKQFRVSVEDIVATESAKGENILQIEQQVTKAAFIAGQGQPFVFLDDSSSEIDSVKALIDEGVIGKAFNIARPGRNAPFENCGMFNQTSAFGWSSFLDRSLNELDKLSENRKKRNRERTTAVKKPRASTRTRASKRRNFYLQLVPKKFEF